MNEGAFLAALAADPLDGVTRRVYADWLEERGDARAEYLRREIELAEIPINDPRWPALAGWVRERVDAHDPAWVAAACPLYEVWICSCPADLVSSLIHKVRTLTGMSHEDAREVWASLPHPVFVAVPLQAALVAVGRLLTQRPYPPSAWLSPKDIVPSASPACPPGVRGHWPEQLQPHWRFALGRTMGHFRTREEVEAASACTNPPGLMRIFESPAVTGPGMGLDLACWQGLGLSRPESGHAASGSMPS